MSDPKAIKAVTSNSEQTPSEPQKTDSIHSTSSSNSQTNIVPMVSKDTVNQPLSLGSTNSNINVQMRPKVEKKQSTRCIRSPVPQSISRQHSTNGVTSNHHRQYVLLRDKSQSTGASSPTILPTLSSNPQSPQLHPQQSQPSLNPGKPKPYLRKQPSTKYVFSVDDNEDEIEQDLTREYLEGYSDALKQRFKSSVQPPNIQDTSTHPIYDRKKELENDVINDLQNANKHIKDLKELECDSVHRSGDLLPADINLINKNNDFASLHASGTQQPGINMNSSNNNNASNKSNINNKPQQSDTTSKTDNQVSGEVIDGSDYDEDEEPNIDPNTDDYDDLASVLSNESFTLRERQVAINETHPFGIRIWKPAIYKKDRSVQKEAELDVHAVPGAKPSIGYSVLFFNIIWFFTFGLLLLIICTILGTITFFFSMFFNPRTNNSLKYAKFYWNLGYYLLYPFGKIVILKTEENYMNEDANVGSSMDEFQRWRTENQGKLFFSAPTSNIHRRESISARHDSNTNLEEGSDNNDMQQVPNSPTSSVTDEDEIFYKKRYFGRGDWTLGRVVFYFSYYLILVPIGLVITFITWLSVFCIPMAKVLTIMASHIRRHPLALSFEDENQYYERQLKNPQSCKNESFLILTYRSFGIHYYKYTVDGTNIFFINLNFLVIFTILDFYLLKNKFNWMIPLTNSTLIFALCLVSIIPLAYFIGQAVASISAQTSMGLGAVINAFFSTIVEVYLYCIALDQSKAKLVEGSLIGSILGGVLLLPGGSMCCGAIKRKTQRYNPASAGVSSTMLTYAILVMLSPTILYEIYGEYKVRCQACDITVGEDCRNCHYYQPSVVIDPLYINYLRPFTVICALSLFLVYCICLLFTLKTHAALIWSNPITTNREKKSDGTTPQQIPPASEVQSVNSFTLNDQNSVINHRKPSLHKVISNSTRNEPSTSATLQNLNSPNINIQGQGQNQSIIQQQTQVESSGGHDAPNWSRTKSTTILLLATLLYAVIAEILVDCVDDVLKSIAINPKFLGLTIFALVPNTTEFVNAFSFAMHGNVALSMEIGSAYALQVCLLQIPIVVLYSVWNFTKEYNGESNLPMLISKAVDGSWVGLPRISHLFGLPSHASNMNDNISNPIENAIAGTFGIAGGISSIDLESFQNIGVDKIFSLIFPHWDFIASLVGVYMFTYIYTEGKSNYFKGSILIFLYLVLISGFYIALRIDSESVGAGSTSMIGRVWNN